jgi:hypothetical protein
MLKNMNDQSTDNINYNVQLKLICAAQCKKFSLEVAARLRPANKFSRTSKSFLSSCEIALRNHIESRIKTHPSKGVTLM